MMRYKLFLTKTINYLVVCVLIAASIPLMASAEYDEQFFSGNDILFYNPEDKGCDTLGTGTVDLVGNDNQEKVLRYFIGKGLTLAQVSGIAGNLQAESSFIPARIQGAGTKVADDNYTPVNGVGFGIAQWTWTTRQQPLVDFAKSSNRKITDLSMQLDFMWQEMTGSHAQSLTEIKKINDPIEAAISFHKWYEGSNDSADKVRAVRGALAKQIYDKYSKNIPDEINNKNTDVSNSTTISTLDCTGDGTASSYADGSGAIGNGEASSYVDGFAIYNQNDPKWNNTIYDGTTTIGEAGCGPSSMAMIITALTGNKVTPVETASYAAKKGLLIEGVGSKHTIGRVVGEHWGLNSKAIDPSVAKVNEVLRSENPHGLILAVAHGGSPYTSFGHFIVIRGVKENGKWVVGDSNGRFSKTNSSREWDPSSILVRGVQLWAITK